MTGSPPLADVESRPILNRAPFKVGSRTLRRERTIALVVVILPMLGVLVAIGLIMQGRVSFLDLGLLIGMYTFTMLGVGVGLHRYFSHGSFKTSQPLRTLLAVLGSMAAQGPVYFWVSIHRRHHAHSDAPGDPHSPNLGFGEGMRESVRGLWHAHTGWMFDDEMADWVRYVPDLLRDRRLFQINQLYFTWVLLGLAIPAILGGVITRSWAGFASGFLWGGLVRIFLVHHASWSLGSISHMFGTSPFPTRDHSTNNIWTAVPTFGESWHNNHHAFPYSAFHGLRWWQIDINGLTILALARASLAWDLKTPSERNILEASSRRSTEVTSQPDRITT